MGSAVVSQLKCKATMVAQGHGIFGQGLSREILPANNPHTNFLIRGIPIKLLFKTGRVSCKGSNCKSEGQLFSYDKSIESMLLNP